MFRRAVFSLALLTGPALAGPEDERCVADVAEMRELASILPAADLSRRFAEQALDTAMIEMSAGEVDDCPELVARARHVIMTRPYVLRPGEKFGAQPR